MGGRGRKKLEGKKLKHLREEAVARRREKSRETVQEGRKKGGGEAAAFCNWAEAGTMQLPAGLC